MRLLRRTSIALLLAVAAILATAPRTIPAVQAEDFSGHWFLTFYGKCVVTQVNEAACATLQSPAIFAAAAVPGATLVVKGTGDYHANASGRYTVHFTTVVTERIPGGKAPAHCTNALVFDGSYTGACTEIGGGHGHIAGGKTGMPDFWQDDATGFWKGNPPAAFAESSVTDTLNPACAGTLDTRHFLGLLGLHHVPAGITAKLVLTHTR